MALPYHSELAEESSVLASPDPIPTSRRLLEQAEREYRAGDVLQASEKGWGAAAHAVKAIAEERGWEHDRHGHLVRAARAVEISPGARRGR